MGLRWRADGRDHELRRGGRPRSRRRAGDAGGGDLARRDECRTTYSPTGGSFPATAAGHRVGRHVSGVQLRWGPDAARRICVFAPHRAFGRRRGKPFPQELIFAAVIRYRPARRVWEAGPARGDLGYGYQDTGSVDNSITGSGFLAAAGVSVLAKPKWTVDLQARYGSVWYDGIRARNLSFALSVGRVRSGEPAKTSTPAARVAGRPGGAEGSAESAPPITRPSLGMRYGNDLDIGAHPAIHDHVGESVKDEPPGPPNVSWPCLRRLGDLA